MIARIKRGIGSPGKLWTGQIPTDGVLINFRIVQRSCPCGATTRKFKFEEIVASPEAMAAIDPLTVFVTMGGVGSVVPRDYSPPSGEPEKSLQCWNWSGRVGGYVIVQPLLVLGGYYDTVTAVKPGYRWVTTYQGTTLSEHVLIHEGAQGHFPETIRLTGQCPKCRERQNVEETPETLMVSREDVTRAGVTGIIDEINEKFGESTPRFSARELLSLAWQYRLDDLKKIVNDATRAAAAGEAVPEATEGPLPPA